MDFVISPTITPDGVKATDFRGKCDGLDSPPRIRITIEHIPSGLFACGYVFRGSDGGPIIYDLLVNRVRVLMAGLAAQAERP